MNDPFEYLKEDKQASKEIAAEFGDGYLPPPPQITIDSPEAFPGDDVAFYNPRRPRDPFDIGRVVHLETHWHGPEEYQHVYFIRPFCRKRIIRINSICQKIDPYKTFIPDKICK